jgi:hypothetical protein
MLPTIYPLTLFDTAIHYAPGDTPQTIQLEANTAQTENRDTFLNELSEYGLGSPSLMGLTWDQRVTLARQAQGTWTDREGMGTSVEVVRQLRDEWD